MLSVLHFNTFSSIKQTSDDFNPCFQPLRRALTRMGAPGSLAQSLIPDTLDNSLSYSVLNYLKRLKNQAKIEFDRLCNEVGSKPPPSSIKSSGGSSAVTEGVRVTPRSPLKKDLVSHPLLQGMSLEIS